MRRRSAFIDSAQLQLLAIISITGAYLREIGCTAKRGKSIHWDEGTAIWHCFLMVADITTAAAHIWQEEVEPYLERLFSTHGPDTRFRLSKVRALAGVGGATLQTDRRGSGCDPAPSWQSKSPALHAQYQKSWEFGVPQPASIASYQTVRGLCRRRVHWRGYRLGINPKIRAHCYCPC